MQPPVEAGDPTITVIALMAKSAVRGSVHVAAGVAASQVNPRPQWMWPLLLALPHVVVAEGTQVLLLCSLHGWSFTLAEHLWLRKIRMVLPPIDLSQRSR